MKNLLFFLVVLISSCQSEYQQKASKYECEKFKTGVFYHTSQGDPTRYKIQRNDSIQTEFIGKSGDFVNLKITWTSPCSYELTFLNQHIIKNDSFLNPIQFRKVKVEILKIQNDSCFVIADNGVKQFPGVVYIDRK